MLYAELNEQNTLNIFLPLILSLDIFENMNHNTVEVKHSDITNKRHACGIQDHF